MGHSRSDDGVFHPLVEHRRFSDDALSTLDSSDLDEGGKGRNVESYWARFRKPSPTWIISIFTIYEFIFGVLLVTEFNATFALICHQQYFTRETRPDDPLQTNDLLQELKQCLANEHAQSDLSRFLVYGQVTAGLLGAISTPILGSLSDRFGRKKILASATIGPLMYEILMVLTLRYPDFISMRWLLVGYAMEGLSGTMITAGTTSQAYITDLVGPTDRARLFSYLQASFSFAAAVGPVVSGILLTVPNALEVIYRLAVGSHILLTLVFLFVLPESRKHDQETPISERSTVENPIRIFLTSFKAVSRSTGGRKKNILILAGIELIAFGLMIGLIALQLEHVSFMFKWQATTQSFFTSLVYSWSILVLVVIFPAVMARFRRRKRREVPELSAVFNVGELSAIQISLILQMIGYAGMALAKVPSYFILSSFIVASTAPLVPLLSSCLTAHVPASQSGQLLGLLSFVHAIARVVVPASLNATYSITVGMFPAPVFVLLSCIMGFLLLVSMYIKTNTL